MGQAAETAVIDATAALRHLPVRDVIPTPDNKRCIDRNAAAHRELVQSVKESGILQPLLGRPHPEKAGKIDLRAGQRRLVAARDAGLATVPVIVRGMTDQEALEVTITENLQRETLTPLEEADTLALLFERGWEAEAVAAHIGKGASWVRRRSQLTELTQAWRTEISEGHLREWSAAHAERVARLPAEIQDQVLDEWRKRKVYTHGGRITRVQERAGVTLKDLDRELAEWTREIKRAPWKLDDGTLEPEAGPCTECVSRSSREPSLFDELDGADEKAVKGNDRCLVPHCWESKFDAWLQRREAELKAQHPKLILLGQASTIRKDVVRSYKYHTAKKGSPGAVPALVVDGAGAGTLKHVAMDDYYAREARRSAPGPDGKPAAKTIKERREALGKRRQVLFVKKVQERLKTAPVTQVSAEVLERRAILGALTACFGTRGEYAWESRRKGWASYHKFLAKSDVALDEEVWKVLKKTLHIEINYNGGTPAVKDAREVCRLINIDGKALEKEASQAIPDPKSWAALKPDGTPKKEPAKKKAAKKAPKKAKGKTKKGAKK